MLPSHPVLLSTMADRSPRLSSDAARTEWLQNISGGNNGSLDEYAVAVEVEQGIDARKSVLRGRATPFTTYVPERGRSLAVRD